MYNNFFYNDKFYPDLEEFMIDLEIDEENIESADDFYTCYESSYEPIVKLSPDWIVDRIDGERFSEDGPDGDILWNLLKNLDFDTFNEKCPKLYYQTWRKFEITKADLYQAL